MREMILYGPSKYDLIWNYESVAISDMAAAQGRWGNLAVYYPKPTLWSNHPFVVLKGTGSRPSSARPRCELREFLLSPEVQTRALEFGFRPANPEVKVLSTDPQQPVEPPQAVRRAPGRARGGRAAVRRGHAAPARDVAARGRAAVPLKTAAPGL